MRIADVASLFGPYVKFVTEEIGGGVEPVAGPNAFHMLMNSARSLQALSLPIRISHVTNQKQKLHNDVIEFFKRRQLQWKQSDVAGVGNSFLKVVVDTLWFLDGHYPCFMQKKSQNS
ncbi:Hypothetical predicted protein [Paramuricea clavata]|uniref:Uncharacterized protein n=1 Tax=Paramuricea clavata TaxID=317549 RepID=A0A7D9L0A7_PARCT|nr:Hypothetical predicted protein [Paramuricea clavata]